MGTHSLGESGVIKSSNAPFACLVTHAATKNWDGVFRWRQQDHPPVLLCKNWQDLQWFTHVNHAQGLGELHDVGNHPHIILNEGLLSEQGVTGPFITTHVQTTKTALRNENCI